MWLYEKKLEHPVKIKTPNAALAKVIISQLGGPDGELGAATRYLQQRYSMPYAQVKGMLTDVGTEELAHIEMISAILFQLTRNLSMTDIKCSGFDTYFVDHTTGIYPQAASGVPFSAGSLQVTGDPLADLYEDLAAEQKARVSYDNILRLIDDPDVRDPIKFLREREIVHFQRFGDALRITQDNLDAKNFYAFNPGFDRHCNPSDIGITPPTPIEPRSCHTSPICPCNPAPVCPHEPVACPHEHMHEPACSSMPMMPACGCKSKPVCPHEPMPICAFEPVPVCPSKCAPHVCPVEPMPITNCGCDHKPACSCPAAPKCGCCNPSHTPTPYMKRSKHSEVGCGCG